jgi:predicted ester cyclase
LGGETSPINIQPEGLTLGGTAMSMSDTARAFFEACETGKGWEECEKYCTPGATFSAQAEPLTDIKTLAAYADWMRDLVGYMPDARYDLRSWAVDEERRNVSAYAVFSATHTGEGGPCPPTGKSTKADYVYVMFFDGETIGHMTKIWHSWLTMQELGWA